MASRTAAQRVDTFNLRVSPTQRTLIDRAAEVSGKTRTQFMLEAACREAGSVLTDRRHFVLDESAYERFIKALDQPPANNPRLRDLLKSKAPWEK